MSDVFGKGNTRKTALALSFFLGIPSAILLVLLYQNGGSLSMTSVVSLIICVVVGATIAYHIMLMAVQFNDDVLVAGVGLYKASVPLAAILVGGSRKTFIQECGLVRRVNGLSIGRVKLGWFRQNSGRKVFVSVTGRSVVLIETNLSYDLVLTLTESQAESLMKSRNGKFAEQ